MSNQGGGRRHLWIMLAAGLIFHVAPRLRAWTLLHIHKEDGAIFLRDFLVTGWDSTFQLYSGYTHVVPRVLTALGVTLLPLDWFAAWVGISVALVKCGLAFLGYEVFRTWVPDKMALLAACAILFVPIGQQEVLGNYTNLRWYMAATIVVIAMDRGNGWLRSLSLFLVMSLAVFTEPLTVLAVPILLVGVVVTRGWARVLRAAGLGLIAVNMFLVVRSDDRGDVPGPFYYVLNLTEGIQNVLVRGLAAPLGGQNVAMLGMSHVGRAYAVVGVVILVVMLILSTGRKARELLLPWTLVLMGWAELIVTLGYTDPAAVSLDNWFAVGQVSRYSLGAALLVVPGVALLLPADVTRADRWRRALAAALVGMLTIGCLADARGDGSKAVGPTWAESLGSARNSCGSVPTHTLLQFTPNDTAVKWQADVPCDVIEP